MEPTFIASPESNVTAEFTPWAPWDARLSLRDPFGEPAHEYGGVYILAHFQGKSPEGPARVLDDAIVYVGEGAYFKRRWYDFERSALHGLSGHSGGHSHRAWSTNGGGSWSSLHVAAFPIRFASEGDTDASHSLARRFRMYVEQAVLWSITAHRHGRSGPILLNVK